MGQVDEYMRYTLDCAWLRKHGKQKQNKVCTREGVCYGNISMEIKEFTRITGIPEYTSYYMRNDAPRVALSYHTGHGKTPCVELVLDGYFIRLGTRVFHSAVTYPFRSFCLPLAGDCTNLLQRMREFDMPQDMRLFIPGQELTDAETSDFLRLINPWRFRSPLILPWHQLLQEDRCPLPWHLMHEIVRFL